MTILEKNSIVEELEAIKQLRLENLLWQRHSEFIDVMYIYFGLKERPSNIPINFGDIKEEGLIYTQESQNNWRIKINRKFMEEPLDKNVGVELLTPHETAHYLHVLRQPEFYTKTYKEFSEREQRHVERVAELATLVFLDESGRGGAEQYWQLNWRSAGKPTENGRPYWGNVPKTAVCTWISNMDNLKLARERLKLMTSLTRSEFELVNDHDILHKIVLFNK